MAPPSSSAVPFSARWHRHGWWVAGLGLAGLAAWLRVPLPRCLFHALTGWPCPLCGSTRAFRALAHGEWGAALHVSPLACLLALALALAGLWHLAALLWPGAEPPRLPAVPSRWRTPLLLALLAAVFANWGYRLATGQH